jgi:hypothetical protein
MNLHKRFREDLRKASTNLIGVQLGFKKGSEEEAHTEYWLAKWRRTNNLMQKAIKSEQYERAKKLRKLLEVYRKNMIKTKRTMVKK